MSRSSPSSSSVFNVTIPGVNVDVRNQNSTLRQKILHNEHDRLELDQKLRSMLLKTMPDHRRRQVQHIQSYFNQINRESQQAEQRNLSLLRNLTEAQQRLDQLHNETEGLIRLKNDYLAYLESHYPDWQRPISASIDTLNEYDRLEQKLVQDRLNNEGNLRAAVVPVRQSFDPESSMLYKRYEDLLKSRLDRTQSPVNPQMSIDPKDEEQSVSETNEIEENYFRSRQRDSLRISLTIAGLNLLIDFVEEQIPNTIDKTKIYSDDKPSVSQKTQIVQIANRQDKISLRTFDAPLVSMVILDQLHSTIQRNTIHKSLITNEILYYNPSDFDVDSIADHLPSKDRSLWLKLINHFGILLKHHIIDISSLVEKFALLLLTTNVQDLLTKAKNLLHVVLEKYRKKKSSNDNQHSSSESTDNS